jgi:hypothetical protein
MTFYDVWLDQPEHPAAFFVVVEGIQAGRWRGEQTDPLAWQAQMTRAEIEALIWKRRAARAENPSGTSSTLPEASGTLIEPKSE